MTPSRESCVSTIVRHRFCERAIAVVLENVVEAIELGKKARKAPQAEQPEPGAAPRRRVGRPAAAPSGEPVSVPAGGETPETKPVAVAEAEPKPVVKDTAAPATAIEPEPAP